MEDIETGQAPTVASHADDDCTGREGNLTSASSAPNALETQAVLASSGSPMPPSPSHLQIQPYTVSAEGISPASSPNASAGVLSKLLSVNGRGLKRSPSGTQPVCLICLENLTPEDFEV